jgi:hypothetical protein
MRQTMCGIRSHVVQRAKSNVTIWYHLSDLSPQEIKDRVKYLLIADRFQCPENKQEVFKYNFSMFILLAEDL